MYNVFSFLLLKEISPVSHSVWGSFKRLFIIYFAVVYFRNEVTLLNAMGSLIAVVGVIIYSSLPEPVQKIENKEKKEEGESIGIALPTKDQQYVV